VATATPCGALASKDQGRRALLITGDIAWSGATEQYGVAKTWLLGLTAQLIELGIQKLQQTGVLCEPPEE